MPEGEQSAADSRSQAFVAVEGATKEDIAGGPLMLAAYALIWAFLLLYVLRLAKLHDGTQRDIERLTKTLDRGPASGPSTARQPASDPGAVTES